jgi:hypothetical protein
MNLRGHPHDQEQAQERGNQVRLMKFATERVHNVPRESGCLPR